MHRMTLSAAAALFGIGAAFLPETASANVAGPTSMAKALGPAADVQTVHHKPGHHGGPPWTRQQGWDHRGWDRPGWNDPPPRRWGDSGGWQRDCWRPVFDRFGNFRGRERVC